MGNNYCYEFEHDSKYCYPNSKVLKNKLDIDDAVELEEAERKITSVLTMEAVQKGIRGKFNFNHLKKIHKFLFGDIYSWAGKVRLVNISKGNQFCKVEFIEEQMNEIFRKLGKENTLRDIQSKKELAERLAYYFGEINAIHTFREGNGRTQRLFMQLLCNSLGYDLDFTKITSEEMLQASDKSFKLDYELLIELMERALSKN